MAMQACPGGPTCWVRCANLACSKRYQVDNEVIIESGIFGSKVQYVTLLIICLFVSLLEQQQGDPPVQDDLWRFWPLVTPVSKVGPTTKKKKKSGIYYLVFRQKLQNLRAALHGKLNFKWSGRAELELVCFW